MYKVILPNLFVLAQHHRRLKMRLATNNRHERDDAIQFEPATHTYTVTTNTHGTEVVPVTITSFSSSYFKQFNPDLVVSQHFRAWEKNTDSKYHSLIHSSRNCECTDDEIKLKIKKLWADAGAEAAYLGTRMHEKFELISNGQVVEDDKETQLFERWRGEYEPSMQWEPFRSEWMLWWEDERIDNHVLVAGTLDLLLKSKTTGEFSLVDFKRTNPSPKYANGPANLLGQTTTYNCRHARGPLDSVQDDKFGLYTMQLNIISKILRDRYDIDVKDRMYLLQIHQDMDNYNFVKVEEHCKATDCLFSVEAERRRMQDSSRREIGW